MGKEEGVKGDRRAQRQGGESNAWGGAKADEVRAKAARASCMDV